MWDRNKVVFSDADTRELAHMYRVAVEKGFADGQGADSLHMSRAEIHRLYEKVLGMVGGSENPRKLDLKDMINKPGMPRQPKKHTW